MEKLLPPPITVPDRRLEHLAEKVVVHGRVRFFEFVPWNEVVEWEVAQWGYWHATADNELNPGSDLVGETAVSMAASSIVEQLYRIFKLCGSPSDDYWLKSKLPHSTVFKPVRPYEWHVGEAFKYFPSPSIGLMLNYSQVCPKNPSWVGSNPSNYETKVTDPTHTDNVSSSGFVATSVVLFSITKEVVKHSATYTIQLPASKKEKIMFTEGLDTNAVRWVKEVCD
ncbi:hypothetical protein L6452_01295 [Arctium lappa]|uniref:Uncharacterized protein n=1 Tax=Arctium lappa TaxID=4217 RepID=A0ACB9FHR2_ARCLA|nr:hypothetical protein L6452_01295 [Arctium lappa]